MEPAADRVACHEQISPRDRKGERAPSGANVERLRIEVDIPSATLAVEASAFDAVVRPHNEDNSVEGGRNRDGPGPKDGARWDDG